MCDQPKCNRGTQGKNLELEKKIQEMGHHIRKLDPKMENLCSRFSQVPTFLNSLQNAMASGFKVRDDTRIDKLQRVHEEIKSLGGVFVANLQQMESILLELEKMDTTSWKPPLARLRSDVVGSVKTISDQVTKRQMQHSTVNGRVEQMQNNS